eukprot:UN27966
MGNFTGITLKLFSTCVSLSCSCVNLVWGFEYVSLDATFKCTMRLAGRVKNEKEYYQTWVCHSIMQYTGRKGVKFERIFEDVFIFQKGKSGRIYNSDTRLVMAILADRGCDWSRVRRECNITNLEYQEWMCAKNLRNMILFAVTCISLYLAYRKIIPQSKM